MTRAGRLTLTAGFPENELVVTRRVLSTTGLGGQGTEGLCGVARLA